MWLLWMHPVTRPLHMFDLRMREEMVDFWTIFLSEKDKLNIFNEIAIRPIF